MRPLFAHAVSEHESLMSQSGAMRYLRKDGWIKLYRTKASCEATKRERDLATSLGLRHRELSEVEVRELEPSLAPVFDHAVHWPEAASVSNPLAVTKAYASQFTLLGGITLKGDARTLHRSGDGWRVDTEEGPLDAKIAVVALGPWAPGGSNPLPTQPPLTFWTRTRSQPSPSLAPTASQRRHRSCGP